MTETFKVNQINSLLEPILYRPSPHCDDRPAEVFIDMVVVHGISLPPGEFGLFIRRDMEQWSQLALKAGIKLRE